MTAINFEYANVTLGRNQKGVLPIAAYQGVSDKNIPVTVTCWQPSDTERVRIAAGEPIYLMLQCVQPPPQNLVVDCPFQEPPYKRRQDLDRERIVKRWSETLEMEIEYKELDEAWEETATGIITYK